MKTQLLSSYYIDKDVNRERELTLSICRNLVAGFDRIHYFVTTEEEYYEIRYIIKNTKRSDNTRTYITEVDQVDFKSMADNGLQDYINVIQNLDVSFDITHLTKLTNLFLWSPKKLFVALTRWDVTREGVFLLDRPDSQDTFCFVGPVDVNIPCSASPGWDNRAVFEFNKLGYTCINPSRDIVTQHLHRVQKNNYRVEGTGAVIASTICPEPYLLLPPQTILECLQKLNT